MNYVRKRNVLKALFQENKTLDHKKWAINKERKMVDLKLEAYRMYEHDGFRYSRELV